MVDLSPEVRESAVLALKDRPRSEFKDLLLAGLRYPWAAVPAHAAEALVALREKDTIPALVKALEAPDPADPFTIKMGKKEVPVVRELVRVNHLSNCVLCHAPSTNRADLIRGAVPVLGKPLPAPATTPQYYERGENFVRADITYLRQDFSVIQTVAQPGQWPANQRYDYMVRLRRPSAKELKFFEKVRAERPLTPQRKALLFALRELTGKDLGTTAEDWKRLLKGSRPPEAPGEGPERAAGRDWKQFFPVALLDTEVSVQEVAARLGKELARAPVAQQGVLVEKLRDGKGPEYTQALAGAIGQLQGETRREARQALADRLANFKPTTVLAYLGSDDPELRRAAALAVGMKDDKAHIGELIELLRDPEPSVVHATHAALKSLTGEDFGPAPKATAEERAKVAVAWTAWWKKQAGQPLSSKR
jgi:hypothetical protein